ncbi:MAG TPA: VanZ family protein [Burkholderiaceae bacterium]
MQASANAPQTPLNSPFARATLVAYMFLIVYASCYPFSDWRDLGVSPTAFFTTHMPRYWTKFDAGVNIVGYIPFGMLLMFSLYPRIRGVLAVLLAIAIGTAFSTLMEVIQTYLPSRVPSTLDIATNVAGAAIGALLGAWLSRPLIDHSRLARLRARWFDSGLTRGLVVASLWPLAQIYPLPYLFGHGQVLGKISDLLSGWLDTPVDLAMMILRGKVFTVEQYWLSETLITACGMAGAALTFLCLMKPEAPRGRLALGMIALALTVKTLASALLFSPENAFAWITPGAQGGLIIGAMLLAGLTFAPPIAQRRLAALTLLISLVVVNIVPPNPYFLATLQGWVQGKFLNFNGAAQFLSLLWPFLALWFLSHPVPARKMQKT